jgi:hypothetical protein
VVYLVVGLDQDTLAPWHHNVLARDVMTAQRMAVARAKAQGINLAVAAVLGPNTSLLTLDVDELERRSRAP